MYFIDEKNAFRDCRLNCIKYLKQATYRDIKSTKQIFTQLVFFYQLRIQFNYVLGIFLSITYSIQLRIRQPNANTESLITREFFQGIDLTCTIKYFLAKFKIHGVSSFLLNVIMHY